MKERKILTLLVLFRPKKPLPKLPINAKLNPINDSRTYQSRHKKRIL